MHLDSDGAASFRPHIQFADSYAPRPVLEALLSLAQPGSNDDILASLAAREESEEAEKSTVWRVAWLTATDIAYVEASRAMASWALDTQDQVHDRLSGWTRPLDSIEAVTIDDVTSAGRELGDSWQWDASTSVLFRDGTVLLLPLFGGLATSGATETETFRSAVMSHWRNSR